MERLRNRVSPIPSSSSNVFPTVLEEPVTPSDENHPEVRHPASARRKNSTEFCSVGDSPTDQQPSNNGHMFRKHRRRLPLVQPISRNSRSSRSFDSGISCLLSSESSGSSPGPNSVSASDHVVGSPNHISSSRQSSYISSPCNSPGPRSPRLAGIVPSRNPLSPRPHPVSGGLYFGFPRRFSDVPTNGGGGLANSNGCGESYTNSTKSSDDSDSSPPTTEPSPPPLNGNGNSPPPTSPTILRVSRRMLPETPKSPYNVWQQSRDSLDSGVYSRSTTCDSYIQGGGGGRGNNPGSPVLSSTSPPTLTRHSWRRGGVARLPEPPVNNQQQQITSAAVVSAPATVVPTTDPPPSSGSGGLVENNLANLPATMASTTIDEQKRVHFEGGFNSGNGSSSPAKNNHSSRSVSLLTSLKNTYQAKLDHSPVKSTGSGILNKLHEKLAATRSNPASSAAAVGTGTTSGGYSGTVPLSGNLDVPKLRDLKSHSFPPIPFATTTSSVNATNNSEIFNKTANNIINTNNTTINETTLLSDTTSNCVITSNTISSYHHHHQPHVNYYLGPLENNITTCNNIITSNHQVYPSSLNPNNTIDCINSQYILHDTEEDSYLTTTTSYETTDDRRRKWLQYNHNNNASAG